MVSPAFVDPDGHVRAGHAATAPLERLIASSGDSPQNLLATLRAHQVPPAAVAPLVQDAAPALAADAVWTEAVERSRARAERLRRAAELTEAALAGLSGRVALPGTSLGPAWSSDVDVLLGPGTLAEAEARLREAGFLDLNALLERLGRATADVRRFGAVAGTEVLASVELCLRLFDSGPPAQDALSRVPSPPNGGLPRLAGPDRVRRRCGKVAARRRATVRDILELAALREELGVLPQLPDVAAATSRCDALALELTDPGAAPARQVPGRVPSLTWVRARTHGVRRETLRVLRPRRLQIAVSGIDGSGKSTQAKLLTELLERVAIPSVAVWTRIGFGGSPLLSAAARLAQRLLPAGSHSAQTARATGTAGPVPLTRRGPVGWSWALAVTLDYLRCARRASRRARGMVVVFDRALPDALVELDQGYAGALPLRVQRRLIERLSPRPDLTIHLRLAGAEAHARKADLFVPEVLEQYARRYEALLPVLGPVLVMDARRPRDELALEALRRISGS
jgi:hypothetical protein